MCHEQPRLFSSTETFNKTGGINTGVEGGRFGRLHWNGLGYNTFLSSGKFETMVKVSGDSLLGKKPRFSWG